MNEHEKSIKCRGKIYIENAIIIGALVWGLNRIRIIDRKRTKTINCKNYKNYGARGITVCEEWLNKEKTSIPGTCINNISKGFLAFKVWALTNGYKEGLTIDRIDSNKGYSPENCRWVTMKEQNNHTGHNRLCTYKDKTQTLKQWCEELNLNYSKTIQRILSGWTVEKAFETASDPRSKMITYKNKTQPLASWCKELGLNYSTSFHRLRRGWTVEQLFENYQTFSTR